MTGPPEHAYRDSTLSSGPPVLTCPFADPYNWSSWRKHVLLVQVAFHAMLGAFSAAAVIPSFETFVEEFDITITQASYFVSVPIIFLGMSSAGPPLHRNMHIAISDPR